MSTTSTGRIQVVPTLPMGSYFKHSDIQGYDTILYLAVCHYDFTFYQVDGIYWVRVQDVASVMPEKDFRALECKLVQTMILE